MLQWDRTATGAEKRGFSLPLGTNQEVRDQTGGQQMPPGECWAQQSGGAVSLKVPRYHFAFTFLLLCLPLGTV